MQVAHHSLRVCVAKPQQVTGGWVNASTTLFSKVKHLYMAITIVKRAFAPDLYAETE
jgi:hypothetical protein